MPELPKQYDPKAAEAHAWERWDSAAAFSADPRSVLRGDQKPYAVVIPPPNVTARLHLGHALNNTIQDTLVRANRMKGFEPLWMPGTDHAGIATQTVVERRLMEQEGKRRTDYARVEFVAHVQAFKDDYEQQITEQLKAMGASCDWDRQRFTMDETCARAVREAFFILFRDGLIYRGKRLVNWDPVTGTALADDEVDMVEVDGTFSYMRYPLVHAPANPDDPQDTEPVTWSELAARGYPTEHIEGEDEQPAWVTVATTRPETYLGDTGVAVNPQDARATALRGLRVQLPVVGRVIPIVEDDYVVLPDPESSDAKAKMATGFLKVTPAHDPNDFEIGRRHHLDIINVMAPDASISADFGWAEADADGARAGHVFMGKSREEARKLVHREFEARNLLQDIKPHRHSVGHSYRSHAAIEPYFTDQWYVRVTDDKLRGSAQRALHRAQRESEGYKPRTGVKSDSTIHFHPARYAKTYEQWHDNLRDWCISRQLWWGHQIPVWSKPFGTFRNFIGEEDSKQDKLVNLMMSLRDHDDSTPIVYRLVSASDMSVPLREPSEIQECEDLVCLVCVRRPGAFETEKYGTIEFETLLEEAGFERDQDVLDTWFSSALWPMSTMGWPEPAIAGDEFNGLLDACNPTAVLCTAREIITLWVSRMVMFNRYFLVGQNEEAGTGPVPFDDVFIHAMIQDGQGRKMSKSLGNGVDPMDIIESHGADAMRFTLAQMTTHTQDVRMPVEPDAKTGKNTSPKFDIGRNVCNKLWNATRLVMGILEQAGPPAATVSTSDLGVVDRWMLTRLSAAITEMDAALQSYNFHNYAEAFYTLFWRDFCDWYLEAIKPTVRENANQRAVLRATLEAILRIAHPVMPFITESIAEHLADHNLPQVEGLTLEPSRRGDVLATAGWPICDASLSDATTADLFERARDLVGAIREVRAKHNVKPRRAITLHAPKELADAIEPVADVVRILAELESITTDMPEGDAATCGYDGFELRLTNLADEVDAGAERERLERQITELDGSRTTLETRLANPGYTERAPEKLVQQTRDQLERVKQELATAHQALERLS
ncbi:MAG: valine--tRNA ligase [Phycisphaerales bacterium]